MRALLRRIAAWWVERRINAAIAQHDWQRARDYYHAHKRRWG